MPDLVEAFCDSWRKVNNSMGQEVRQKNSSKGQQQVALEDLEVTNKGEAGGWEDLAQPRRSSRVRRSRVKGAGEEDRGQSRAFVPADRLRLPEVVEEDNRGRGERRERRERLKVERLQFERLEEERLEVERQKLERQIERQVKKRLEAVRLKEERLKEETQM